ncbi:MAG: protein kinase [candidate division KSB1 bacterium]|nr:protein kinase [candidate division KSB1 bacterium]MDQ7065359.1 protein kinase [candidate division KSB1 bacterium]
MHENKILHYAILEKLGEGGMGVVYKALDTKLDRTVAIKFLPGHIGADAEERKRFEIEAKAAAALNHPNITTIHAIEEHSGEMFIVMEYIEGRELRDIVEAAGPPTPADAMDFAMQIAAGLQAAHEKGIVHRDIKSANIMVTPSGRVKVMDFGLAKIGAGAQLTREQSTLGTVAYMSPEQTRGEPVDHRTDIWAFGVVLYEMLTGELPFKGDYEQATIYSILNEEPEYPGDLPSRWKAILQRALAKDRNRRYSQINELMQELGAASAGTENSRSTTSPPVRMRRRWAFSLGGAVLALLMLAVWFLRPGSMQQPAIHSIAVLPLTNLSGDPAQDYFSDGMTEALITDLSKIRALKVISRTSVMPYKNATESLPEIARKLGVQAIIEGSVMRDGQRIRISAQLIDAKNDRHLWAQSYERNLADVFALQRDIAQAIAAQVRVTLTPGEQKQLEEVKTIAPEAYEAYLKGVYYDIKYNPSDFLKSLDYFSRAVKIEPDFTQGYIGIVRAATGLMDVGSLPFSELYSIGKAALDKAMQLGDSRAEVLSILGRFKHVAEWDWAGAEEAFRKSLVLNPNMSNTYFDYASFLIGMGRGEESLAMIQKARALDPLNAGTNNDVGWLLYMNRRYDEAIREYRHNLEMYPNFVMSHRELSWVYAKKSLFAEAIASAQRALELERSSYNLAQLANVTAMAGNREESLRVLDELFARQDSDPVAAYEFAMIYSSLGDVDKSFEWLEKSYQEHSGWPFLIKADPLADPLRSDPRFGPFLKRFGLEH